jgi:hypothetical protein
LLAVFFVAPLLQFGVACSLQPAVRLVFMPLIQEKGWQLNGNAIAVRSALCPACAGALKADRLVRLFIVQ